MSQTQILYRKTGWKYTLSEPYEHPRIIPEFEPYSGRIDGYLELLRGQLVVHMGYSWDGPSGPTIDTKNSMRCSLVHDALYQLTRDAIRPRTSGQWDALQDGADVELYRVAREDGMGWMRARLWLRMLRRFGGSHIRGDQSEDQVLVAP